MKLIYNDNTDIRHGKAMKIIMICPLSTCVIISYGLAESISVLEKHLLNVVRHSNGICDNIPACIITPDYNSIYYLDGPFILIHIFIFVAVCRMCVCVYLVEFDVNMPVV